MNTKKKNYKSLRFWIISLLAVSTAAFSTSLVLSSCTTSDDKNQEIKSDVTITNQPDENQEVSADKQGGLTLTIEAKSEKGKPLKYQWYANKNDGKGWQPIDGATGSTYNIPQSELQQVTTEKTWQYRAEIQYNDGTDAMFTTNTYGVKVKPSDTTNPPTDTDKPTTYPDIKTDVTLSNTPQTSQEVSANTTSGIDLSVTATSKQNKALTYQWYSSKSKDGSTSWSKITSATSNSYTIPKEDINAVTSQETWKYKVEIKYQGDTSTSNVYTSGEYSVTIKPVTVTPPVNPSPTPPTPDQPTTPSKPDNTPENPDIIPSPEHKPSEGIGARLPADSSGLTTVKYAQEKWVGDNSFSIAIDAVLDVTKIDKIVSDYTNNYPSNNGGDYNANRLLQNMVGSMKDGTNSNVIEYNQLGTGWILDYSKDSAKNLTSYYIATNMHVLSANFNISFKSEVTLKNSTGQYYGEVIPVTASAKIPFNSSLLKSLNVYISQPQYSETSYKNNTNTYIDNYGTQWYKTNITKDNFGDYFLPIGASTKASASTSSALTTPNGYDLEIAFANDDKNFKGSVYFKPNSDGNWLSKPNIQKITGAIEPSDLQKVDDFSVLKFDMTDQELSSLINKSNGTYQTMFNKMYAMLNTNTSDSEAAKNSSYIPRLNALLTLTTAKSDIEKNKSQIDSLFLFSDESKLKVGDTQLSYAGFPQKTEVDSSNKKRYYTTFNSNTMTVKGDNIIDYPPDTYWTRNVVGLNQYSYKGTLYKINWSGPHNYLVKNANLLPGSSGGMAVDQDYKISSVNWGTYNYKQNINGIDYLIESSSITAVYKSNDESTLIWRWVNYISKNDTNSKLAQLFSNLKSSNYFNS